MLISKVDFVKYIDSLQEQYKYYCELGKLLSEELQENILEIFTKPQEILSDVSFTKDQQDWVNWWLWDAPNDSKRVVITELGKQREYILDTPEKLYDFLVLHYSDTKNLKRKHVLALKGIYKRSQTNG